MNYTALINVMPHRELLDPQGKTVSNNMTHLDISDVHDVRIGKHIEMHLSASSREAAEQKVETACKKLLSNPVMEYYEYELQEA